jgi:hypothetical protein
MIDRHKSERAGSANPKGERPASSEQTRTGSGQQFLKPVGVGAAYQRSIPTVERCGLQMHIAATESVSLCVRMKS